MKATINHGKRGKSIDVLLKRFEMKYPYDFYGYIIESYINGHKSQVIELFNMMKEDQQKTFLLNASGMGQYGEKVHDLIIQYL